MAELGNIVVTVDPGDIRRMVRDTPPVEALARELHDVVFAFGNPIPAFDQLQPETQQWFRDRARMLVERILGEEA